PALRNQAHSRTVLTPQYLQCFCFSSMSLVSRDQQSLKGFYLGRAMRCNFVFIGHLGPLSIRQLMAPIEQIEHGICQDHRCWLVCRSIRIERSCGLVSSVCTELPNEITEEAMCWCPSEASNVPHPSDP